MNKKSISMQTIADKLGISKVTVFKAFKEQSGVGEELRKQILDLSSELGYNYKKREQKQTNHHFLILMSKSSMVDDEQFYTVILYHINALCAENGDTMNLYIISDETSEDSYLKQICSKNDVSGIFILGQLNKNTVSDIVEIGNPVVAVDFYYADMKFDYVVTNNFYSAYAATMHLINCGYKKIGFSGDTSIYSSIMDRYLGYLKALMENGLEINESYTIIEADKNNTYFEDFKLPDKLPEAYFCHCDLAAYTLIQRLTKMGYKVPDDIAVIGFDNTQIASNSVPLITTVNVDKENMAVIAYNIMKKRLKNPLAKQEKVMLILEIIKRQSTIQMIANPNINSLN
jgi:LacI family transcriptional regulator